MKQLPDSSPNSKPTLEEVRNRFETWRQSRKPRSRIPKCLWKAAVDVCVDNPIWQVSRALRLNHTELKQRVKESGQLLSNSNDPKGKFIELSLGVKEPKPTTCTVELESASGSKLKMTFTGNCRGFDPLQLTEAFWRGQS
jgi:hypothetical protein